MKQYFISIAFSLVCSSFIFISCEKESPKETVLTPCDMYRKYLLIDVRAKLPIDINFDGIENIDLTKEIDVFQDCFIYFTDKELTIAWPEAQVNPYPTPNIPISYTGQDIKYSAVPRYYTYTYGSGTDDTYASIYPVEIREEGLQSYFRFGPPTWIQVDKVQNIIMFDCAYQYFLTKKGLENRQLIAVFKPDPEDGYVR
ncbi:MAG: hypothetical protein FWD60_00620 [Candidatus Azobacteroides sp.]|nr:hypothetical protein [Candidatus Azobacteroides sp.]